MTDEKATKCNNSKNNDPASQKGLLVLISGPSGVGKGTIVKGLLKKDNNLRLSISATTRDKRPLERHGKDYYFYNKEEFLNLAQNGEMLEYASYVGNFYGTPKKPVNLFREQGIDVLLEIETKGGKQIIEIVPDVLSIFILPPSTKELEKRLLYRGTNSKLDIKDRLNRAAEELKDASFYKYKVTNDDAERASQEVYDIICKHRLTLNFNSKETNTNI